MGIPIKHTRLLCGFPPSLIQAEASVLACRVIAVNDTVVVRSEAPSATEKVKRAEAASSSGNNVKGCGDESPEKKKKKKANHKRVSDVSSSSISSTNRAGARKMAKHGGLGRTLSGMSVPAPTSNVRAASKKGVNRRGTMLNLGNSEGDVASTLLSALGPGGGGKKVGRFLRGAMRGAVGKSYEASRAQVRVAAVNSKQVEFEDRSEHGTSLNGLTKFVAVKYSKGIEGRGLYEEVIEIIGLDALKAVIDQVYSADDENDESEFEEDKINSSKEMLRPVNMSQLSPRVFWSLAYHFPQTDTVKALQKLHPTKDWRYLSGRTKMLSEKARENLRQERIAKGEISEHINNNGLDVVEAVEEAMKDTYDKLYSTEKLSLRDKMADAANSRLNPSTVINYEKWKLITPDDYDEDELKECVRETAELSEILNASDQVTLVHILVNDCKVKNWRQLANLETDKILHAVKAKDRFPNVEMQVLDALVENAQLRSLDEIMMEIMNYNEDAVISLRDYGQIKTPKDLYMWRSLPEMLLSTVKERIEDINFNVTDVLSWCERAQCSMQQLELDWLNWFVS